MRNLSALIKAKRRTTPTLFYVLYCEVCDSSFIFPCCRGIHVLYYKAQTATVGYPLLGGIKQGTNLFACFSIIWIPRLYANFATRHHPTGCFKSSFKTFIRYINLSLFDRKNSELTLMWEDTFLYIIFRFRCDFRGRERNVSPVMNYFPWATERVWREFYNLTCRTYLHIINICRLQLLTISWWWNDGELHVTNQNSLHKIVDFQMFIYVPL
jgi:hypothetical protein